MLTGYTIRGHRRFPVKCAVDYMSSDCVGKDATTIRIKKLTGVMRHNATYELDRYIAWAEMPGDTGIGAGSSPQRGKGRRSSTGVSLRSLFCMAIRTLPFGRNRGT